MRCPKCNYDLRKDFLDVYKLGFLDAKNRFTKHLNLIEKSNSKLFEQLRVMDLREPDKVNSVYLSRKYLEKLCRILGRNHLGVKASEIKKIINEQLGETLSAEARLREVLEELQE